METNLTQLSIASKLLRLDDLEISQPSHIAKSYKVPKDDMRRGGMHGKWWWSSRIELDCVQVTWAGIVSGRNAWSLKNSFLSPAVASSCLCLSQAWYGSHYVYGCAQSSDYTLCDCIKTSLVAPYLHPLFVQAMMGCVPSYDPVPITQAKHLEMAKSSVQLYKSPNINK